MATLSSLQILCADVKTQQQAHQQITAAFEEAYLFVEMEVHDQCVALAVIEVETCLRRLSKDQQLTQTQLAAAVFLMLEAGKKLGEDRAVQAVCPITETLLAW